jgi:hypothetical protein
MARKTMASRFVVGENDVIEELKTTSENSTTRKSTNLLVGVFKKRVGREGMSIKKHRRRFKNLTSNSQLLTYE